MVYILTFTEMCVDTHIPGSASETFVVLVWYVFASLGVYVLFGEAKVYDMYSIVPFCGIATDEKVLWFHVSVYQVPCMNVFHAVELQGRKINDAIEADADDNRSSR